MVTLKVKEMDSEHLDGTCGSRRGSALVFSILASDETDGSADEDGIWCVFYGIGRREGAREWANEGEGHTSESSPDFVSSNQGFGFLNNINIRSKTLNKKNNHKNPETSHLLVADFSVH
jgi:hypothetical protein